MKTSLVSAIAAMVSLSSGPALGEPDYYRHLRYPARLLPSVGRNKVEQEGGPNATGYRRRTVHWWPRKGQDIVDIPDGAPLRIWTRNKGQHDPEALAGVCRSWAESDPPTFKSHLIGFRGFGTSTVNPVSGHVLIPAAVLRMEDGRPRAVINYGPVSQMLSNEDHAFIHKIWERAYPKLYATVSRDDRPMADRPPGGFGGEAPLTLWTAATPKFNAIELSPDKAKYPRWGWQGDSLVFETSHFHILARPKHWGQPPNWIRPDDVSRQNGYRKHVLEFVENFWTYVEGAGASMPYWRREGPSYKYVIHVHRSRAAGGWGHCGIGDCSPHILGHEFFHGQPYGGWDGLFIETMCNSGQHTALPGELQMFNGNFRYPWRNVNTMGYQSSLWFFVLGDNPNWGYGIQTVAGCLAGASEPTPYHTIARLGQKRGLWDNGVKGFGDFFGEYAARMVTCDFVEQYTIRSKYGMPEMSYLCPVYGRENRYRISNAEAPRPYGFNIIRLEKTEGAKEIKVDLRGLHDPAQHSDWRACIVAVDSRGRARYSALWNQGEMRFPLATTDMHLWLTVAATPAAMPVCRSPARRGGYGTFLTGTHAPRYPWEVTLTGCRPGSPHRRQGDVAGFDELYALCDSGNTYLNYSVKQEVPIPLDEPHGTLAQEKLAAMLPRIQAAAKAVQDSMEAGWNRTGWWESKKTMRLSDLVQRVEFLQRNAKGHRHPNGGGFVADTARVDSTAYVGPDAMVLDGARVKDHACIRDFAVVHGPKTVVSGHARIGGRAWVFGDIEVSGNARILEAATVTTIRRTPTTPSQRHEGRAKLTGSAVIKGETFLFLAYATDQTVTGGVVLDYTPDVENRDTGVFRHGRFYRQHPGRAPSFRGGVDAGGLYANWQFNQPKAVLLEDSYVNNNGILHGQPTFTDDGEHQYVVFNGKDQYAEAPPSVADFGQLTIDMRVHWSGHQEGRLFDFGTGAGECFYLTLEPGTGTLALTARHDGQRYEVATSTGLQAGRWAVVRVEMTGSEARLFIDGTQAARKPFAFRPRMVFPGDRPEGNFLACGRNKTHFFRGRMDHFRIYRAVHPNFDSLGPAPLPLTQLQEWSEKTREHADAWEGRRRAEEAKLTAGAYGRMLEEIRRLQEQKTALQKAGTLADPETLKLDGRIAELRKDSTALRDAALRQVGLYGPNPYPGSEAARVKRFQEDLIYHTTADWDDRTPEEVRGQVPLKMKKWLQRVRGY